MTTLPIIKYAFDPTGVREENKITNEPHQVEIKRVGLLIPNHNPFYTDSVEVFDEASGRRLVRDVDYYLTEYSEVPSRITGLEACCLVVITNKTLGGRFLINYQAVGGGFDRNLDSIIEMIRKLDNDQRPVEWPNIIDKPDRYTPTSHLHDAGDTFGWEYVVQALENLRRSILLGDVASHDEILLYIDKIKNDLMNSLEGLSDDLDDHLRDKRNPHSVTKSQVGLSKIPNSITHERMQNTDSSLLTAKAMRDHILSNDHDGEYVSLGKELPGAIRVVGNRSEVYVNGAWRQFWPPLWQ